MTTCIVVGWRERTRATAEEQKQAKLESEHRSCNTSPKGQTTVWSAVMSTEARRCSSVTPMGSDDQLVLESS